jgi:hypothetical protein
LAHMILHSTTLTCEPQAASRTRLWERLKA